MGAECEIHLLTNEFAEAYDLWLSNHEASMFYHTRRYIKMISALTGGQEQIFVAFDKNKSILGVLPVMSHDGSFGIVYNSLAFYGSHGGVLAQSKDVAERLMAHWNGLIQSSSCASATLIENIGDESAFLGGIVHHITDERIGQITPIAYTEDHDDKLMASYHSKTRNMVRKSQKQNFSISVENDAVEFLYDTHVANLKSIGGLAKDRQFFDLFPSLFVAGNDYKIWVARDNGTPVAALLLFYYKGTVEYFTPVIVDEYRDRQPLSLLIYESMCDASRSGYSRWNWGGTWASQDGVYLFKKRWGAADRPYRYYTHIGNQDVYNATSTELLTQYPGFFVIPFRCLIERKIA